jgi:hypothetical protein
MRAQEKIDWQVAAGWTAAAMTCAMFWGGVFVLLKVLL